jgi:UDP-glucuronate decarboxylase
VLQLAHKIIELTQSRSTINFQKALSDDPRQRKPDIKIASANLDWFPHTNLDIGLQSTIDWMTTMEKQNAK